MKEAQRQEARRLRKEKGLPISEIAKKLSVAKSSVSLWVRDIELTEEQNAILLSKNPVFNHQCLGGKIRKENALKIREGFQKDGRKMARSGNLDFVSLCMLYWAEGNKSRCVAGISNTDVNLLRMVVSAMKRHFGLSNDDFSIIIQWYSNNGLSLNEIQKYWVEQLGLSPTCLRKCRADNISKYSQKKKKNRHPYGTCRVNVAKTDVVQKIYGAIQELGGFNRPEWLW